MNTLDAEIKHWEEAVIEAQKALDDVNKNPLCYKEGAAETVRATLGLIRRALLGFQTVKESLKKTDP